MIRAGARLSRSPERRLRTLEGGAHRDVSASDQRSVPRSSPGRSRQGGPASWALGLWRIVFYPRGVMRTANLLRVSFAMTAVTDLLLSACANDEPAPRPVSVTRDSAGIAIVENRAPTNPGVATRCGPVREASHESSAPGPRARANPWHFLVLQSCPPQPDFPSPVGADRCRRSRQGNQGAALSRMASTNARKNASPKPTFTTVRRPATGGIGASTPPECSTT